jgi:hypothetical protein
VNCAEPVTLAVPSLRGTGSPIGDGGIGPVLTERAL